MEQAGCAFAVGSALKIPGPGGDAAEAATVQTEGKMPLGASGVRERSFKIGAPWGRCAPSGRAALHAGGVHRPRKHSRRTWRASWSSRPRRCAEWATPWESSSASLLGARSVVAEEDARVRRGVGASGTPRAPVAEARGTGRREPRSFDTLMGIRIALGDRGLWLNAAVDRLSPLKARMAHPGRGRVPQAASAARCRQCGYPTSRRRWCSRLCSRVSEDVIPAMRGGALTTGRLEFCVEPQCIRVVEPIGSGGW